MSKTINPTKWLIELHGEKKWYNKEDMEKLWNSPYWINAKILTFE